MTLMADRCTYWVSVFRYDPRNETDPVPDEEYCRLAKGHSGNHEINIDGYIQQEPNNEHQM